MREVSLRLPFVSLVVLNILEQSLASCKIKGAVTARPMVRVFGLSLFNHREKTRNLRTLSSVLRHPARRVMGGTVCTPGDSMTRCIVEDLSFVTQMDVVGTVFKSVDKRETSTVKFNMVMDAWLPIGTVSISLLDGFYGSN